LSLSWRYIGWYYNRCRIVLAPSLAVRDQLENRLGIPTTLFSRGVDSERFNPDYCRPHSKLTALYVGRISEEKNLRLLQRVFGSRSGVELVVVGDGPYRREMEAALPNATFTGFLTGRDLSEAYASADFFVFPSETDTFGNVVLEAMSSGLPVLVSSKMGPQGMVTHARNGFVCRDEKAFQETIDLLLSDADLRLRMGLEARSFALAQSWRKVFDRLFRTYALVQDGEPISFSRIEDRDLEQSLEAT
jgi:glycosyltransferase involved in cell wall biosynthesis